jgi:hypothetical protein
MKLSVVVAAVAVKLVLNLRQTSFELPVPALLVAAISSVEPI